MTYIYISPDNRIVSDGQGWSGIASALPNGTVISPYVAPVQTVAQCIANIDADTDAIYDAMMGSRAEEYTAAAADAHAYKDAGYTGPVPAGVQSWATAQAWTPKQACDDILKTAADWTAAKDALRAARLLRKVQVRNAPTDPVARATAMTAWAGFVTTIRNQLGIP